MRIQDAQRRSVQARANKDITEYGRLVREIRGLRDEKNRLPRLASEQIFNGLNTIERKNDVIDLHG